VNITHPEEALFSKSLFFGPSGNGKTRLLGTAMQDERTRPMLYLDYEGGASTLAGLNVDMVRIRKWDDFSDTYNELLRNITNGTNIYKSVGIDSISETHLQALLTILDNEGTSRRNPDALQQGDYGTAQIQMRRLLRKFRDLPLHVFFTSLAKDVLEPGTLAVKKPALPGQMADELPGIMDVVGYLGLKARGEGEDPERLLCLKNYPQFRCKVRTPWAISGQVPDEIEDPTITKLLDALSSGSYDLEDPKEAAKEQDIVAATPTPVTAKA
jgi:hypothetical protein